ncbi:caspase-like cysteine protease [Reticulomyxa filosa]|uniref:separase n=1 Tax=Reticulomyxa filosa TaxID=46433 RepID=X6NA86_RETFI|nr:caspase-like cysteine protease [Reticulomyxa filosa]|eukprot:ETO22911.1 caspase-like cysteine protease [Reticulomyxa filosa]
MLQELEMKSTTTTTSAAKTWEEIFLIAKIKSCIVELSCTVPRAGNCNDPVNQLNVEKCARDSLQMYVRLVERLTQQFIQAHSGNDDPKKKEGKLTLGTFVDHLHQIRKQTHEWKHFNSKNVSMLYHYPTEYGLLSEFLNMLRCLGFIYDIKHEPNLSLYHFKHGEKASNNLLANTHRHIFAMDVCKIQCKQKPQEAATEEMLSSQLKCSNENISQWKLLHNDVMGIEQLKHRMFTSISRGTPWASQFFHFMKIDQHICSGDFYRAQQRWEQSVPQYNDALQLIDAFFNKFVYIIFFFLKCHALFFQFLLHFYFLKNNIKIIKKNKYVKQHKPSTNAAKQKTKNKSRRGNNTNNESNSMDLVANIAIEMCIPWIRLKTRILVKKAQSELFSGRANNAIDICSNVLERHANLLDDLLLCKTKLLFAQASISLNTWHQTQAAQYLEDVLFTLLQLPLANPNLIEAASVALAVIYAQSAPNIAAFCLNLSESVQTRQKAIRIYEKKCAEEASQEKKQQNYFTPAPALRTRRRTRQVPLDNKNEMLQDITSSLNKLSLRKEEKNRDNDNGNNNDNDNDKGNGNNNNDNGSNDNNDNDQSKNKSNDSNQDDVMHTKQSKILQKLDIIRYKCLRQPNVSIKSMADQFYQTCVQPLPNKWRFNFLFLFVYCTIYNKQTKNSIELMYVYVLYISIVSIAMDRTLKCLVISHIYGNECQYVASIPFQCSRNNSYKSHEGGSDDNKAGDEPSRSELCKSSRRIAAHSRRRHEATLKEKSAIDNLKTWLESFGVLIDEINQSTHSGQDAATSQQVKDWWDLRRKLDSNLKDMLQQWNDQMLGVYKYLLLPALQHEVLNEWAKHLAAKVCGYNRQEAVFLVSKMAQCFLTQDAIGQDIVRRDMETLLQMQLSSTIWNEMVDQSSRCTEHGKLLFHPLLLCVGDKLTQIAWESLPVIQQLRTPLSICRVPSIEFATIRVLERGIKQSAKSGYYIINPRGDLVKSEKRFRKFLEQCLGDNSCLIRWSGMMGAEPRETDFIAGLENNEVLLYVGHNGGEKFISCQKIESLNIQSVTFLMGCSSGHLKANGIYQSQGLPNSYMIASWYVFSHVTVCVSKLNGDIDTFTMDVLEKCVLTKKCELSQGLSLSRNACKMRYLNGCAPVCYGIPTMLE